LAQARLLRRALLTIALVLAACGDTKEAAPPATFAPVSSIMRGFDPITTTSAATTATAAPVIDETTLTTSAARPIDVLLAELVVEPEHSGADYDRDLFEHWIDADHNGCNTRCEVLNAERRTDVPGLASGWYSLYDGYTTDDPGELDIDHVVALGEAWRSGADAWDAARRRAYANDLDEPDALIAVTAATNRSKGDRDPARWQPPNRDGWCQWGTAWLKVKVKWHLSADQAEADALGNVLRAC
jgi:hypothetical protein